MRLAGNILIGLGVLMLASALGVVYAYILTGWSLPGQDRDAALALVSVLGGPTTIAIGAGLRA